MLYNARVFVQDGTDKRFNIFYRTSENDLYALHLLFHNHSGQMLFPQMEVAQVSSANFLICREPHAATCPPTLSEFNVWNLRKI